MPPSLAEVELLVEQLSAEDRAELRKRMVNHGNKRLDMSSVSKESDAAWANFLRIGAEIAALPSVSGKSVLEQLCDDRR